MMEQEVIESRRVLPRSEFSETVKRHSQIRPVFVSWAILRQWLIIVGCFFFALHFNNWASYIFAAIVIASRQHALGILMHDATHYRLFKNKFINDTVSDFFCALPVGLTTEGYRYEHLLHHHYTNTKDDPYWILFEEDPIWHWPKTTSQALFVFLGDLLGYNLKKNVLLISRWAPYRNLVYKGVYSPLTAAEKIRLTVFLTILVTALSVTGFWLPFYVLWVLPAMTITLLMTRVRTIAEHLALPASNELEDTRHVDATLFEKLTICPLNINYHIAHHIFPSVPYYNLPSLHRELLKHPLYQKKALCLPNYTSLSNGVFADLIYSPLPKNQGTVT